MKETQEMWLFNVIFVIGGGLCSRALYQWTQKKSDGLKPIPNIGIFCGSLLVIVALIRPMWSQPSEIFLMLALFFAHINAIYDWQEQYVFDYLTILMMICATLALFIIEPTNLMSELFVGGLIALSGGLIAKLTCIIGLGDVFFFVGCSLLVGWQQLDNVLLLAIIMGGFIGCYLALRKQLGVTTRIAFTPLLLLALVLLL